MLYERFVKYDVEENYLKNIAKISLRMLYRAKLNISTRIDNVVSQSAESITNAVFLLPLSLCKRSISSKS